MNLQTDLVFIENLAREAGAIVREHYGKVSRLTKRGAEAVTDADRNSQRHIVKALNARFPTDGIIGEENETGDAITFDCRDPLGRNWVIDPIDGTNNFIAGLGLFAVCIGLMDKGHPVLGVIYDVTRDWMYKAAKGHGAFLNDQPIKVLETPMSESSLLMCTSNLLDPNGKCPQYAYRWLSEPNMKLRMIGTAALEAMQVAAGVAHGALTVNGKLWDAAPPLAIVLEAGGVVTNLTGGPVFPFDLRNYSGAKVPFLAAAPKAHAEILKDINR